METEEPITVTLTEAQVHALLTCGLLIDSFSEHNCGRYEPTMQDVLQTTPGCIVALGDEFADPTLRAMMLRWATEVDEA